MLSRIGEIGAYLTFAASFALVGIMFYNIHPANFSQLLVFTNNTGDAGGGVVPLTSNPLVALGYAMLLPMWIITSYDASAHTSEETVDAARAVPKAMVSSVLLSAGVGILMLISFALAMADPSAVAKQGSDAFAFLFGQVEAPSVVKSYISVTMVLAAYICGACALTGYSRATFAFSRDGGLPKQFRRVSKQFRTPANAIWACAVVSIAVTLYSSAFSALVGGIALFYQLCYGMTIAAALFARNRSYGPYRLGIMSKPFALLAIIGGVAVIYIGLQPPTDILINYFIGIIGILVILWFAFERKRFPGPPVDAQAIAERQEDIRTLEEKSA